MVWRRVFDRAEVAALGGQRRPAGESSHLIVRMRLRAGAAIRGDF